MSEWIMYVFILAVKVFIPSLSITFLLVLINKKFKNELLKGIINYLFYIPAAMFLVIILDFFVTIFVYAISFVYNSLNGAMYFFIKNHAASTYISLVIALVVLAYFPDLIGRLFIRLYDRIAKTGLQMESRYSEVVKFIRFKLWIYLAAFILMLLSTTETILQRSLFSFNLWLELKPVILQSVVTFIALDRFLKLLGDEWKTIKVDFGKVINTLKSIFRDLTVQKKDGLGS